LHCHPLPCRPAAPSSRYPAAASPRYHSAAPSSGCFVAPLPASSRQFLLSAALPAHAPRLVHPILVLVVVVPVVPPRGFPLVIIGARFRGMLLGRSACFHCPIPGINVVSRLRRGCPRPPHRGCRLVVLCLCSAGLSGAPPRPASFSRPCLVVTAICLLPLTRRLRRAWYSSAFSLPHAAPVVPRRFCGCCGPVVP
jgi:hypothetical protein